MWAKGRFINHPEVKTKEHLYKPRGFAFCPAEQEKKEGAAVASYHCEVQIIKRSAGRSAINAAAYRSGGVLTCPETGEIHDYARKSGILDAFIMAPAGAPDFVMNQQTLWSAVHAKEKRKNSQLAREFELALPHELTVAEGAELVRQWVQTNLVDEGMVADVALHDPERRGDGEGNRHAHVMTTMRRLDADRPDGWSSNKAREWNDTTMLERWRASWADAQNAAFIARGLSVRVDHRSLEDQHAEAVAEGREIDALVLSRDPEPRLGVAAAGMEARGHVTERGEALRETRADREALFALAEDARAAEAALDAATGDFIMSAPIPDITTAQELDDMHDITKTAVTRQLKGLGLDVVEISVIGGDRPHVRTMTPDEVIADLPRLKRANKAGCSIYVRGPRDRDHDLVLIDDIDRFTPKRMEADGLKPAVVIETSPDNFQAWLRLGVPTPADVRHEVSRILCERYGGDAGAIDPHQSGRLAGFTNPKPEHKSGRYSPFVKLHSYAGRVGVAVRDLLSAAKSALRAKPKAAKVNIAPDVDTDLVAWWRNGYADAPTPDLSAVDWSLTHQALASGHAADDVAAALASVADRKGKDAEKYAVRTVAKAEAARTSETRPDDDTPSPF